MSIPVYIPISLSLGRAPKIPSGRHVLQGGVTIYVREGEKHRENGPAEINTRTGYKAWFWKGKRHRVDGPAVVYPDGKEEYWVNGKKVKPPKKG